MKASRRKKHTVPKSRRFLSSFGLTMLSIIAVFFGFWIMLLFDQTFIPLPVLLLMATFGFMASGLILIFRGPKDISAGWLTLHAALIGGVLPCFALLYLNREMNIDPPVTTVVPILDRGTKG
ncbi:MAG TPA: hypothetical protein VHK69_01450, partial [Chitinophagaceae bacterium]|nr:hypothetical protein [Chitinophagaceae bacterium]